MPVETAADRAGFLNVAEFGVRARYLPEIGAEAAVDGIFDQAHLIAEAGEAGVSGAAPVLFVTAESLAALPMRAAQATDRIIIDGVTYAVNDIQPDGTGMVALILERR